MNNTNPYGLLVTGDPIEDAWLGVDTTTTVNIEDNPLFIKEQFFEDNPGMAETNCLRQIDYIGWTAHKLLNLKLHPFQMVVQQELLNHSFPMFIGARGCSKTFSLALFSLLTAILNREYKVVLAGASFRQSKAIFAYAADMYLNSPVLRSMCNKNSKIKEHADRLELTVNNSLITAIPIGHDGEKIRGLRSNCTIVDEFKSHNPRIVEEVLFGFGSVKADPVNSVIAAARRKKLKDMGHKIIEVEESPIKKNKCVISGTADYHFNHFYDYWQRYKKIIQSKGDQKILEEIFQGDIPEAFDWKDYSIIRIPYSALPPGFMDSAIVARAKAQMPKALYLKEYEAVFVEDSDGFFSRKQIEECVASEKNIDGDRWVKYCPTPFDPLTCGNPDSNYVIGVDPAAKHDNFAIVVLEVFPDHQRIVHCWTTNEKDFINRKNNGLTTYDSYFSFCAGRIQDLFKVFPTKHIGVDAQGGGFALIEAMGSKQLIPDDELPLLKYIDLDKPAITDDIPGHHVVYPISFSNQLWSHESNWSLRRDIEEKKILFPNYDELTVELSIAATQMKEEAFRRQNFNKKLLMVDTLEDCAEEIENLKDELTNIVYTRTGIANREHWDTPRVKTGKTSQVAGKKDRYSALLIANYLARDFRAEMKEQINFSSREIVGGLVRNFNSSDKKQQLYSAPSWFSDGVSN